ncbi:hypothetical protein GCM10017576_29260 [Microbacterium barkeri]|uniref:Uncharacterized protein n=1 Tax=Microbacterium barkeri TaxID=33917 RepID=A0A9W6H660_9MICO|nr:hypothetical protein [Microbacterium barkeri]MDR6875106.1 hypothetical protein [Microbacterium barkeri]GLJ62795.1 hypothetical protein GCM10017576_29260 [Microbacterium barkeri]
MDIRTQIPNPAPTIRPPASRPLTWVGVALATVALAAAGVWLVAPDAGPFAEGGTPLEQLLGGPAPFASSAAGAILALAGVLALAAGLASLAGWRSLDRAAPAFALIASLAVALGLVGFDGIVIAGYTLATLVPIGVVVVIALLARRRPLAAVALAVPVVAVVVLAVTGVFPIGMFYARFTESVLDDPVRFVGALGLTVFAGVWMGWAATSTAAALPRMGAFVQRHRVVITVFAALCPAPYVVARLTWLTPWPLFGGDLEAFAEHPDMFVTGLLLGAAMLLGAVLTLGLVLPWGERAPRWVPGIGGQPVPIALAVVPALSVAVLFTAGGVQELGLIVSGQLHGASALVLPFWAWGPLLALATWGYARKRMAEVR